MKRSTVLVLALGLALVVPPRLGAEETPRIERVPLDRHHLSLLSGSELYLGFCAVCHGVTGRGNGPAARALETIPSDLTTLAARNDGE